MSVEGVRVGGTRRLVPGVGVASAASRRRGRGGIGRWSATASRRMISWTLNATIPGSAGGVWSGVTGGGGWVLVVSFRPAAVTAAMAEGRAAALNPRPSPAARPAGRTVAAAGHCHLPVRCPARTPDRRADRRRDRQPRRAGRPSLPGAAADVCSRPWIGPRPWRARAPGASAPRRRNLPAGTAAEFVAFADLALRALSDEASRPGAPLRRLWASAPVVEALPSLFALARRLEGTRP